jgi:CBS domain-containing protein
MNSALERLFSLQVRDVMRHDVVVLSPDQTMAAAANKLLEHEISGTPVVNDTGVCVGLVSAKDFVRREARRDALESLSSPATGHAARCQGAACANFGDDERVQDYMTRGVRWVDAKHSLVDAARLMCEGHVHRLVVLDRHEHVAGMISSLDIVSAIVGVVEE